MNDALNETKLKPDDVERIWQLTCAHVVTGVKFDDAFNQACEVYFDLLRLLSQPAGRRYTKGDRYDARVRWEGATGTWYALDER